jgi:hypothetical protein
MTDEGISTVEGARAVLRAVRTLLEGSRAAFQAQQAGDPDADELALGAMARAMDRDWPPTARYQSVALLSATVHWLSEETGKSEDEILDELESDFSR